MKTTFFMTLFFFGLVHAEAQAQVTCVAKNKQVAPPSNERTYTEDGVEKDHQVWKDWKNAHSDWLLRKDWDCCPGLNKQSDRTCKDPSMADDTLVSCTNDSQCGDNKGCYPMSEDDMFHTESDDPAVIEAMAQKEIQFEAQQDEIEEPKAENALCYRDMECESYNCENNRCKTKFVCRYGENGETANGNVKCDEPLIKNAGNICGEDTPPAFFTALLNGVTVNPVQGKQCEFQLAAGNANDQQIRGAAYLGITTMRAAEWLFATTSIGDHEDCTYGIRWMREGMKPLVEQRKALLKQFSADYIRLETEFAKIQAAKENDMTQMESPCGETTTAHDIATRKATGLDYMCFLQRRNELFMGYEGKMHEIAGEMLKLTQGYDQIWGTEKGAKSWMIGSVSRSYDNLGKCRGGKKKKIKKRWGNRYKVKGTHNINKGIFDFDMVNKYMVAIGDGNSKNSFTKKHFMLDPIMPGGWGQGVNFEQFGTGGDRRRKLHGTSGLQTIRSAQYPKIVDYFKSLRTGDIASDSFLYEPEVPNMYEQRGCLNKLDNPECAKMKQFVVNTQDAAFAQMMAYSRHYKRKYKKFFDEDVWRRKLFKRYSTDFTNMGQYYSATVQYRQKQNDCYQKVINGINQNYGGASGGVATGEGQNYYNSTATNYMNGSSTDTNFNKNKSKKAGVRPFAVNLSAYAFSFKTSGNKDGQTSGNSASGSTKFDSAYAGMLAASAKRMSEENAALETKTGRKLADAEKDIKQSIAAAAFAPGGAGSAAGFSGSGSGGSANFGTAATGNAKLVEEDLKKTDAVPGATAGAASGAAAGATAAATGGVIGGMGSGSETSDSASGSGYSDPTGMSDEEKDMMQANLDRNKSEYKTNEDDSLFQVLSKTYQRNLKRILTRKGEGAKEQQNSE